MAQWQDIGLVQSWRNFGESRRILSLLTQAGGLRRAILYGRSQTLFLGLILYVNWKAGREDSLGVWRIEDQLALEGVVCGHQGASLVLSLVSQLCLRGLQERTPCLEVYHRCLTTVTGLTEPWGLRAYLAFEAQILCHAGYGTSLLQNFLAHWRDPTFVAAQQQWDLQAKQFRTVWYDWREWYALRNRLGQLVFI